MSSRSWGSKPIHRHKAKSRSFAKAHDGEAIHGRETHEEFWAEVSRRLRKRQGRQMERDSYALSETAAGHGPISPPRSGNQAVT